MKHRAIFVGLAAGALGLALSHFYLQRLEAQVTGGAKVRVIVAGRDVPLGARLEETLLGVRQVPSAYVDTRHIRVSDVDRVLGLRVSTALKGGEAVLWTDVVSAQSSGRDLSSLVQDGMRAVAIEARAATFDGLLRPGDRVDVLYTTEAGPSHQTTTLLQNVMVLAVGADTGDPDKHRAKNTGARTSVTLSLDAEQSQLLVQAETRGRLRVVLRNPNDIIVQESLPATSVDQLVERKPAMLRSTLAPTREPTRKIEHVR